MRGTPVALLVCGLLTALPAVLAPAPALAHGVHIHQQNGSAVVVEFLFEDHSPLAFEEYEVMAPGARAPHQVGRTDRLGRVVFSPDSEGAWQVKVWTEDGHGGTTTVQVNGDMLVQEEGGARAGQLNKIITGVAVLFGLFGILAMVSKKAR